MKKVLIFLSIVFFVSCSNENDTNQIENVQTENMVVTDSKPLPPIEDAIDEMFYEYVTSIEHIAFESAMQEFHSKLNLTPDAPVLDSQGEIITWITTNLEITDFVSVGQAVAEWDNLVELKHSELNRFTNITDFIVSNELAIVKHYFQKWVLPERTTSNDDDCQEDFDDCNNVADDMYFASLDYYLNNTAGKDRSEIISVVSNKYLQALGKCAEDLLDCLGINN